MSRPRDNQRERLYKAERAIRDTVPYTTRTGDVLSFEEDVLDGTVAGAQELADVICRSKYWKVQWGLFNGPGTGDRILICDKYRGRNWSRGGNTFREKRGVLRPLVYLARPHLSLRIVLLHEMAHWLTSVYDSHHGPRFADSFLGLVRRYMGGEWADALRQEFGHHNVEYRVR